MYKFINDDEGNQIGIVDTNTWLSIPIDLNNRHYAEILAQVKAGTLTIEDAE